MGKFGVLTFYNVKNYGAMLQAFALQCAIEEVGHTSEFVRVIEDTDNKSKKIGIRNYYSVLKNNSFSLKKYLKMRELEHGKYGMFEDFCERYLKQSRKAFYGIEQLKDSSYEYDGFVAGSDMVWSDIGQNLDIYFLTFAKKNQRISYAPSLTGRENETELERKRYTNWLEGMQTLSCREKYGVDYVEKNTHRKCELVLDPTLLLTKEKWIDRLNITEHNSSTRFILCYMFGGISKTLQRKIDKIKKNTGFEVRYIPVMNYEYEQELLGNRIPEYGPREFVDLFSNAELVLTNSYHGLLFSLIMNKDFYLFHRGENNEWAKHEERMNNILELLRLESKYVFEKDFNYDQEEKIDYKIVNKKLSIQRKNSKKYLQEALNSCIENNTDAIQEKKVYMCIADMDNKKCNGCGVCIKVCPKQCITSNTNSEGFLFPSVDKEKCTACGVCIRNCSAINPGLLLYPQNIYAGYGKSHLLTMSASGGIFSTLAEWVITQKNGIVYGAYLDKKEGLCFCKSAENISELKDLLNSKYVQSNMQNIYENCKLEIESGRSVLFSGTPCQIDGMRHYLKKDYANLILIDIICHGVPSPLFFQKYFHFVIGNRVTDFRFRHKFDVANRRSAFDICYLSENSTTHTIIQGMDDTYYRHFLLGNSYRECCYNCYYANEKRIGDITIGDCDSWRKIDGFSKETVLSTILINSSKGVEFWNEVKDLFNYKEMSYEEEYIINHQLRRPSVRPGIRSQIYIDLNNMSWKDFERKYNKKSLTRLVKSMIIKIVKFSL